jgi:hypothetical protein
MVAVIGAARARHFPERSMTDETNVHHLHLVKLDGNAERQSLKPCVAAGANRSRCGPAAGLIAIMPHLIDG